MHLHRVHLLPALGLALSVACSDGPLEPEPIPGPINTPLPSSLNVGDLVRVNVNAESACTGGVYHIARVEAIGDKSMILADTLNPKGGFTTADYERYATRFDTLVYPVDVGAFGAPTDIDGNGRVGIIFTRAVNERTPAGANFVISGFTFSRDLFPKVANSQVGFPCAASNEGEYFYALAPDPRGTINGNTRTTEFVNSATLAVLAHELEHLINASRKIYVNVLSLGFEEQWLDEGLAHVAEELLFYRQSGTAPRANLDTTAIRSSSTIRAAYNAYMFGNAGRYRSYLGNSMSNSPYASDDSLTTRGAAWNWLRYLVDQKLSGVTRSAGAALELNGTGSVNVPGGASGAEYYATLVNGSTTPDVSTAYGITATNTVAPVPSRSPIGGAMSNRAAMALGAVTPTLQRDARFEGRLRAMERAIAPQRLAGARQWYRSRTNGVEVPQGGRFSVSPVPITSPDGDLWFRLANNTRLGMANIQQVFGVDPSLAVSDWSVSHAVDDVSALPADQFLQRSWNWHSIYPGFCQGGGVCPYPLVVQAMVPAVPYTGAINAGGSTHFKFAVPATGSATLTVTSTSTSAAGLRLLVVRTK